MVGSEQPDADGEVIPAGVSFGGYAVRKVGPRPGQALTSEALVFDRRRKNYLAVYNTCCPALDISFDPTELHGVPGDRGNITIWKQDACTGEPRNVTLGGSGLAPPTPYVLLAQIIEYMDKLPDARKEILLFSEGSDALAAEATAGQNRNLELAVKKGQQAGIPVWVVYSEAFPPRARLHNIDSSAFDQTTDAPPNVAEPPSTQDSRLAGLGTDFGSGANDPFAFGGLRPQVQYGLSYLNYLAEHSGGKVFSAGKLAVDIRPFLEEFQQLLSQQYVLEYPGNEPPKKITTRRKLRDVKLLYPRR